MSNNSSVISEPFPYPDEHRGYRLFSDDLESNELVFFHGTAEANLQAILDHGFKPKPPLETISFSNTSELALKYACDARGPASLNGCVIAVRFDSLDGPGVKQEYDCLLVHPTLGPKPTVFRYCVVPSDYRFI